MDQGSLSQNQASNDKLECSSLSITQIRASSPKIGTVKSDPLQTRMLKFDSAALISEFLVCREPAHIRGFIIEGPQYTVVEENKGSGGREKREYRKRKKGVMEEKKGSNGREQRE